MQNEVIAHPRNYLSRHSQPDQQRARLNHARRSFSIRRFYIYTHGRQLV
jgi:hypothetical protein